MFVRRAITCYDEFGIEICNTKFRFQRRNPKIRIWDLRDGSGMNVLLGLGVGSTRRRGKEGKRFDRSESEEEARDRRVSGGAFNARVRLGGLC